MEVRGALNTALYTRLLQDVKVKMEAGTSRPCLSALLWESGPSSGLSETEMAYFTAMPFAAGTSTVRRLTSCSTRDFTDAYPRRSALWNCFSVRPFLHSLVSFP